MRNIQKKNVCPFKYQKLPLAVYSRRDPQRIIWKGDLSGRINSKVLFVNLYTQKKFNGIRCPKKYGYFWDTSVSGLVIWVVAFQKQMNKIKIGIITKPTDNLPENHLLVKTYSTKDLCLRFFLLIEPPDQFFREVFTYSGYYQTQTHFWAPVFDTYSLKFL